MANFGIRTDTSGNFAAITSGTEDVARFGGAAGDNSGQLAGFRNVLINGKLSINQRGVTIAAAAIGSYGPDRWKKVDASNMTQIVEDGNYKYSSVYTLSGVGVTTRQVTSPASGHWTIPSIPITATYVQLELGSIATPFELRPIGLELMLCERYLPSYYAEQGVLTAMAGGATGAYASPPLAVAPRVQPTGLQTVGLWSTNTATASATATPTFTPFGGGWYVNFSVVSALVSNNAVMINGSAGAKLLFTGCEL